MCLQAISAGCGFGPPLILNALVKDFFGAAYFPQDKLTTEMLWFLVCLLFALPVLGICCGAHSFVIFARQGALARSAIIPAVYRKALVLGSSGKVRHSTGQIMNLFSNDITHIQNLFQTFAEPFFAPAQLVVALALIYQQVNVR